MVRATFEDYLSKNQADAIKNCYQSIQSDVRAHVCISNCTYTVALRRVVSLQGPTFPNESVPKRDGYAIVKNLESKLYGVRKGR
jgi:hypothetical protein